MHVLRHSSSFLTRVLWVEICTGRRSGAAHDRDPLPALVEPITPSGH
jgi:hypothetical protein